MLKNKRVLIVGNGKSGKAAFEYAYSCGALQVDYYDDCKAISNKFYDLAVISPAICKKSKEYIALKASGIPIYSELDFAYLMNPFNSIAVSGTNGKTTVVNLVKGMLDSANVSASLIGNMGIPFCLHDNASWQCAEISSFMLEQSRFYRADFSCITNIERDHTDYHVTQDRYVKAKYKLLGMTKQGIAYNPSRITIAKELNYLKGMTYSFDCQTNLFAKEGSIWLNENGRKFEIIKINQLKLYGEHNIENVMAALCLCILSNGYRKEYADFLLGYKGEIYRNQFWGEKWGKKVFNDSKGTNVNSTIAAYKTMVGKTALILGGYDKNQSYLPLLRMLKQDDMIFVCGDNAHKILKEAGMCGVKNYYCASLEQAIIKGLAASVDNLLFSPGCSSFDRFAGFEERGKYFDDFIARL